MLDSLAFREAVKQSVQEIGASCERLRRCVDADTDDPKRGTGRTTAGLLGALANALAYPGTTNRYVDHAEVTSLLHYQNLKAQVERQVEALGLVGVEVRASTWALDITSNFRGIGG